MLKHTKCQTIPKEIQAKRIRINNIFTLVNVLSAFLEKVLINFIR